jgi:hypothetical protein
MPHPGQLRHPLEQLDPARVVPTEHVALAGPAALGGAQVPLRDVAHVHDVRLAVDEGGHAPAQVVADHASGGLARHRVVDRHPEHVGRVHDHDLDPLAHTRGERLGLALVLRVGIGESEAAASVHVILGSGLPGDGGADAGHARGDHHAAHPLPGRRLHRDARRQRVHAPDALGRMRADVPGAVEDDLAPAEGAPQGGAIQHVRSYRLRLDVAQTREPGIITVGHANGLGLGRKLCHVRADEPRGARYADGHNFRVGVLFMPSYTPEPTVTQCRFASSP